MRGSREEDRFRSPMFPRLHVNDTEKGGPRAPPRNKMALYEQLSVPSQRFGSMMPHSGNNESSSVSSMSSSHAGSFERSVFNRFCNSPAPSHSENSFAPYSSGVELSNKMSREQPKSLNSSDNQRLNSTQPLPSNPKHNSFQPHKSNFKHFLLKKSGDEGDRRAPSSANFEPLSSGPHKDRENQPNWNLSFSMQFKSAFEKRNSAFGITNLRARESNACQDPSERSFSVQSNKTPADSSLKRAHQPTNLELGRFQIDSSKRFRGANDQSVPDFVVIEETTVHQDKNLSESNEGFSYSTPTVDKRSQCMVQNGNKNHGGRKHGSLSALTITPDDVVKVLGEKQFWKARKAIVNQQRMFGVQVFELHRLMKVQKLITELPDLLLRDNIYLGKALLKSSPVQKVPSLQPEQQPPPVAKSREISQKPHSIADTNKELAPKPNHESYSHSGASETRPSPWCVPGPGNQWLVPVMTPSEGLVYKPYGAPCHPNAGYMAPVYPPYVQSYFPPYYGMPMMAPSVSGSALEQSSCNMSSRMSRTVTRFVGNVQPSKESEIQGSTGSSIPPKPNKGALPLFPTEKMCVSSDQNAQSNEQQTHVIKVVPHNRKLATESAARIFRFITEERNQCC